jgi:hypothetical protein
MIRHVQLGSTYGAGLSQTNCSIERITVQYNPGQGVNGPFWIGCYTTTLNNDGTVAAPAANAVPVVEAQVNANYETAEVFNRSSPIVPGPVWVGLSSTENSFTAIVAGQTARMDIDIDEFEIAPPALTTAKTASGNTQLIWNNAAAPHFLYDVYVTDLGNSAGAQLYLMLFATDAVIASQIPIQEWKIPIAGTAGVNTPEAGALYLCFGRTAPSQPGGGMAVFSQTGQIAVGQPAKTIYQGCYLAVSTTPGVLTQAAANAAAIQGRYL